MNASTITVHWHNDSQPIYAVDFQPSSDSKSPRLVTGGGDNNVRVWRVNTDSNAENSSTSVEYLSTMRKHTQAVNVVRFDPSGKLLGSAGDDGTLIIWRLANGIIKDFESEEDDDDIKESWEVAVQLRSSTSEINDVCWSPDSKYIVTGSMDNTIRIYKLEVDSQTQKLSGSLVESLKNHSHYVQGVYWDPLNQFIATQSADRSVIIYSIREEDAALKLKLHHKFVKHDNQFMYHSETLQSFFRRLAFSPDGNFLITPAGMWNQTKNLPNSEETGKEEIHEAEKDSADKKVEGTVVNTSFVYARSSLSSSPILKLAGLNKPAIAIAFSPKRFRVDLGPSESSVTNLTYKMIFAIATQDSVIVYGTDVFKPLGFVGNLHYSSITDLTWDLDGKKIIISSTDGFCSIISFDEGVFGAEYKERLPSVQVANEGSKTDTKAAPMQIDVPEMKDSKGDKEKLNAGHFSDDSKPSSSGTIDQFYKPKEKKRITPTLLTQ